MEEKNNNEEIKNLFALASQEINEEEQNNNDNNSIGLNDFIHNQENQDTLPPIEQNKNNDSNISFSTLIPDKKIEEEKQNTNSETNSFVQNNITSKINNDLNINETVEEKEPNISQNQPIENKINNSKEENDSENNPFVQNNITLNTNDNINQNEKAEEKKQNTEQSPFFENENNNSKDENDLNINPFFQNKIELNEKNEHNIDNKLDLTNVRHYKVKIEKKKPRKLKFILGVLSYALFIWLLLIGAALLIYVANIKIKQMKGDYTPPKYNAYVVLTGSMLPEIKVEDVVITKKTEPEKLNEGDIITFASTDERYYGTIITHRIIKKYYDSTTKKYTYVSKGDNNNVQDNALVEQDKIYGKVILKIPKLGYLQVFLASKGGWILVILLPCLAVISFDIMKLLKMIGKKSKLKIAK